MLCFSHVHLDAQRKNAAHVKIFISETPFAPIIDWLSSAGGSKKPIRDTEIWRSKAMKPVETSPWSHLDTP